MTETSYKILFLCTGNSCRSIMAEAILNQLGGKLFEASSAGSKPVGYVHPQALACLKRNGVPAGEPYSKSWDDFTDADMNLVVTVCASAAGEACPVFPGSPAKIHWGLPDPADAQGTDAAVAQIFQAVYDGLHQHLQRFIDAMNAEEHPDIATVAQALGEPKIDFSTESGN